MTEYDFTTFKTNLPQLTAGELEDLELLTSATIATASKNGFKSIAADARRRHEAIMDLIRSIPCS